MSTPCVFPFFRAFLLNQYAIVEKTMQEATDREGSVKCAWCQEIIGVNDQYHQIDTIPVTIWHIEYTPNARFRRFGKDRMFTEECRKQLAMEHNKEV